jgi:integrase
MGSIYKRKWKDPKTGDLVEGNVWWLKYYRKGKPYRESSKTDKITIAQRLLKKREGEISEGKLPGIYFDKVTFDELAKNLITDYRINKKKSLRRVLWVVDCLKESFEGMRATDINTDGIKAHVEKRMSEGLSNASINRELAALKTMFHLAAKCTPPKVNLIPYIPMLEESNVRKGFFELEEYLPLKSALPYYLKPVVTFAYHSGWRLAEILGLQWSQVDLKQGTIRVDDTKNKEPRTIYLNEELMKEIKTLYSNQHLGCPYVFQHNGKRIKKITHAWRTACIKAGLFKILKDTDGKETKVPTKLFHDFRRTGVRNMVRSGISERIAMKITGHKTRSVFDRYNIVNDQDLKEAAMKQQAYHEKQSIAAQANDTKRGEIIPFGQAQNE